MSRTAFPSDGALLDLLSGWLGGRRWFTGKGGASGPSLSFVASVDLPGEVTVRDLLVQDDASGGAVLYQVPLTAYPEDGPRPADGLIGIAEGLAVHDAAADPAGARTLLGMVLSGQQGVGTTASGREASAVGHRATGGGSLPGLDLAAVTDARLLDGEQSNTSVVYSTVQGPDVIGKIFRMLHPGVNPDVEVQSALAAGGCTLVPAPAGDLTGTWEDADGEDVTGHLFFAQEFVPGAQDAWRVAVDAAGHGSDFDAPARALGRATAEVHATLADEMPSRPADEHDREEILARWNGRLDAAIDAAPQLAPLRGAALEVFSATLDEEWPEMQRVHGDFHLGQVLDVPGRGWVLLDFEGEPLRPLTERTEPDLAPRDVAGMLRSFDYAAGSVDHPAAASWAASAREAFLDGYSEVAPPVSDPRRHRALLDALELDKALYEVVYEVRNRPDWVQIPLAAVHRLLGRS